MDSPIVRAQAQIDVAVLGARQHYALPKLLHRMGRLGRLYTDLYFTPQGPTARLIRRLPAGLCSPALDRLLTNSDCELPGDRVVSFNGLGLWYRWRIGRAREILSLEQLYASMGAPFARRIIRHGLQGTHALYSYNGTALELFRHAKRQGIRCVLEQIHIPQDLTRQLLQEELERWPGWEPGLAGKVTSRIMEEREREEWSLADRILGGAPLVIDRIVQHGIPHSRCRVVPYGISLESFPPKPPSDTAARRLRVLFIGDVCLRKGAPYLLEALRSLGSGRVEARFAGQVLVAREKLRPYTEVATFLGPVPWTRIADLYHWADLLVLPSICEGSSLVTYEALACGIPVVATPNAGAWLQEGVDGLTVPTQDAKALAAALDRLAADRKLLCRMGESAIEGRARLGLSAYAERVLSAIDAGT